MEGQQISRICVPRSEQLVGHSWHSALVTFCFHIPARFGLAASRPRVIRVLSIILLRAHEIQHSLLQPQGRPLARSKKEVRRQRWQVPWDCAPFGLVEGVSKVSYKGLAPDGLFESFLLFSSTSAQSISFRGFLTFVSLVANYVNDRKCVFTFYMCRCFKNCMVHCMMLPWACVT